MANTKAQLNAILAVVDIIIEAVQVAGTRGLPEGHLYAHMMVMPGMTLDNFQKLVRLAVSSGKIKSENHLLTAA